MKTLKPIIVERMTKNINNAISNGYSENYFIAAAAAIVSNQFVCYDSPYNGDSGKYTDSLYRLEKDPAIDSYLHIRAGNNCYPEGSDLKSALLRIVDAYQLNN